MSTVRFATSRTDNRALPGLRHFLPLLLLMLHAAVHNACAGCDGLGGTGGGCSGGGGGSLLVFTTNGVSATVTGVDGLILSGVVIPSSYNGLPVTGIGPFAFAGNWINSVTIPNSVTTIEDGAFFNCISLTTVTTGNGVSRIGSSAFAFCSSLSSVYVQGNAPALGLDAFELSGNATIYYLPGTTGWGATFGKRPTRFWSLPNPVILNNTSHSGAQPGGFSFIISWAANVPVVVEAATDLAARNWSAISTNTLAGGWSYFSDPQWTNYPNRFYRLRSP